MGESHTGGRGQQALAWKSPGEHLESGSNLEVLPGTLCQSRPGMVLMPQAGLKGCGARRRLGVSRGCEAGQRRAPVFMLPSCMALVHVGTPPWPPLFPPFLAGGSYLFLEGGCDGGESVQCLTQWLARRCGSVLSN